VFGDKYCFSTCDNGAWMMVCTGAVEPPPPPPVTEAPKAPEPPVFEGFDSTAGCEDKCAGVEEGAEKCDSAAFKDCTCVFGDKYCFSTCDNGAWMMLCTGAVEPPPPPPVTEAPKAPEPPVFDGFNSTAGCEDKCAGVEEGAEKCDSSAFKDCTCVFGDKYCFSECDNGAWMMVCTGVVEPPPPPPVTEAPMAPPLKAPTAAPTKAPVVDTTESPTAAASGPIATMGASLLLGGAVALLVTL